MSRRDWQGTILELGICRPLLFLTGAWLVGAVLGTARALVILAAAEDVQLDGAGDTLPALLYGRWPTGTADSVAGPT